MPHTAHFSRYVKKVKCTLVQAPRLCTGRTAHRGSRGIAVPFHDHGTKRGWGVSVTPRPLFTARKDPVPIVQEAGWAPGPVWTGAENLAPTGIIFLKHLLPSQLNTCLTNYFFCFGFFSPSLNYMCCVLIHNVILCLHFAPFPSRGVVGGGVLLSPHSLPRSG